MASRLSTILLPFDRALLALGVGCNENTISQYRCGNRLPAGSRISSLARAVATLRHGSAVSEAQVTETLDEIIAAIQADTEARKKRA